MENAIYRDKELLALDISQNYAFEKIIREAGSNGELLCPDPECQCRELRYKHGEKRVAYFAHKNNSCCDYSIFDSKNSATMRFITRRLFEHFRKNGYDVQMEKKLLTHHYSHLTFRNYQGEILAVELTTKQMSVVKIKPLLVEFAEKKIKFKWIVIDEVEAAFRENETYFIKRFLLNESRDNNLLIIDFDGNRVAQYRLDATDYEIKDCPFSKLYKEIGKIDELVFENYDIQLKGFDDRFREWQNQKRIKVFELLKREEEQKIKRRQELEEMARRQRGESLLSGETDFQVQPFESLGNTQSHFHSILPTVMDTVIYLATEEEIQRAFNNKSYIDRIVHDLSGIRWVKCRKCGKIAPEKEFYSYGGEEVNMGECYNCLYSKT